MSDYTDETLTAQLSGFNLGAARAASYLLEITGQDKEDLRKAAYNAGIVLSNTSPGYRMADGVDVMVRRVKSGATVDQINDWYRDNR